MTQPRQQLIVQITARSPLAFAERKPGAQFRESLPYVPGAAIFGALGQYLAEEGRFDEAFLRRIRCHNAYPAQYGDAWVRPLPLTALQPKGKSDGPLIDALVERVCWERQQPPALIYLPTDDDGRPWELPDWRFYTLLAGVPQKRRISQRVLTRVAINRQRGTAEDQRLYSPLVLTETSSFLGSIAFDPADMALVAELVPHIRYLGGRQSTGLGKVEVKPYARQDKATEPPISERIEQLTSRFQQQAARYHEWGGGEWTIPARSLFTINLLSDAILLEHGWLPTQEFSADMLEELTGIKATLRRSFTRTLTIGGWAALWQQPKATSLAVGMGSLYLFEAAQPLSAAECTRLEDLQLSGIGTRRQEGFGQVRVCDAFHLLEPSGGKGE
ncbi:MAG: CRISPR-associated RAMP protein Csx10 [Oscillochloris sp.]|nr:CRISPR-associated RAMP protein Csx10 [Oscillochloris sp.]